MTTPAERLAWDIKQVVEDLSRLTDITEQKAADVLLEIFDTWPGPAGSMALDSDDEAPGIRMTEDWRDL